MTLGLKGSLKELKGCSLKHKISETLYNIQLAWERAWKGYDYTDISDYDTYFKYRTINILEEFNQHNIGMFVCPEPYQIGEYDEQINKYILSEEQTKTIVEVLIFHLKMSDEDYCEKVLYGSCVNDDDYVIGCRTAKDYIRIQCVRKQNQDLAMDLLKLFLDQLWY